ncbi:lipoprotein Spr [Fibrobacter sp. UWB15]|uniref:C40 family peptidase n=1 Tax=unclassified Fibrobacter TaxID=2634177 RepID=UPI000A0A9F67|nr:MULTISPECIES: C40 family peptidase [unclassified Fibrobacter]PWJ67153.1 lipoprotein Spr [Fibrobacter sp. UWB6]SMG07141.1 lipoprotein Spr [Fibrobacter sp. UWB15]
MFSHFRTVVPLLALLCLGLTCCSFPVRTGYDRNIGDYKSVPPSETASTPPKEDTQKPTQEAVQETPSDSTKHMNSAEKARAAIKKKEAAKAAQKATPKSDLETYARKWMGAKYVYGKATRTKTDCSGFVMQVYKGYYNIELDHSSSKMYKDSRGKSVSRGGLKEGDLVFFGSLWKIDHVGIYLGGGRFIHASTSKGVMISPMQDKYWGHKYQGARRFK